MWGKFYSKFPGEVVEFDSDASGFLINNDTIANVSAGAIVGGITVSNPRFVGSVVYFTVSGGTQGTVAQALVSVTLASGQIRQGLASILIKRLPAS